MAMHRLCGLQAWDCVCDEAIVTAVHIVDHMLVSNLSPSSVSPQES